MARSQKNLHIYPVAVERVQLRQKSLIQTKPLWNWDRTHCSGLYDEKIEFFKVWDDSLIATYPGPAAALPPGITVDAAFKITYATDKSMTLLANYEPNFYAKYSVSNAKSTIPGLVYTATD